MARPKKQFSAEDLEKARVLISVGRPITEVATYLGTGFNSLKLALLALSGGTEVTKLSIDEAWELMEATFSEVSFKTTAPIKESEEGFYFCRTPDNKMYKCSYDSRGVYMVAKSLGAPKGVEVREVEEPPVEDYTRDQEASPE